MGGLPVAVARGRARNQVTFSGYGVSGRIATGLEP
jgi:hypothetical protein